MNTLTAIAIEILAIFICISIFSPNIIASTERGILIIKARDLKKFSLEHIVEPDCANCNTEE